MPGPIPKRSDQRRRRNKDSSATTVKLPVAAQVAKPPAENRSWHIAAKRWYRSLHHSGQAIFFEPSDWSYAQLAADLLSDELQRDKPRAATIDQVLRMMDNLLTSEGARRRLRVELVRAQQGDTADNVVPMNPVAVYQGG